MTLDEEIGNEIFEGKVLLMECYVNDNSLVYIRDIKWTEENGEFNLSYERTDGKSKLCIWTLSSLPVLIDIDCLTSD